MTSLTITRKLAAALAPIALAGAILAPGASAAQPAKTPAHVNAGNGFHVYNFSSHTLTLDMIQGDKRFDGAPVVGSKLKPGEMHDFELHWTGFQDERDFAQYVDERGHYAFMAAMKVDGMRGLWAGSSTKFSKDYVTTPAGDDQWHPDETTIVVMDKVGTEITIPGSKGQEQAQVLKQLCDESSEATCTFEATKEEHAVSDERYAGAAVPNNTDLDVRTTIHASDVVSESNTLGVEASIGFEKLVKVEVKAKYEHEWTSKHEFSQEIESDVPPHTKVWFTHKAPVLRDTGNFTIKLRNTTWHLNDVTFETPDTTPKAMQEEYIPHEQKLTAHEKQVLEANPDARLKP